jgi:transposase
MLSYREKLDELKLVEEIKNAKFGSQRRKLEALLHLARSTQATDKVSAELGISDSSLRSWTKSYVINGVATLVDVREARGTMLSDDHLDLIDAWLQNRIGDKPPSAPEVVEFIRDSIGLDIRSPTTGQNILRKLGYRQVLARDKAHLSIRKR